MNFQEKLKTLSQKNSEISKIKSEIFQLSSGIFEEFYQYIFEKYPTLDSFGWTQYTPYFNDGETCVFYANTDYITVNGEYFEDAEWSHKVKVFDWGTYDRVSKTYVGRVEEDNPDYDAVLSEACGEIVDFLNKFDNDFYLTKFGDHAEITVTRTGVDISDYDHD